MKKLATALLLCIGLSVPSITLASAIEPGYDLFETPADGGTYVELPEIGKIPLEGNPKLLASAGLGNTDTIVKRIQGIDPFFFQIPPPDDYPNGEGTVEIELVALSLKSIEPISIDTSKLPPEARRIVDHYKGPADVLVTVNALGIKGLPQIDPLPASTGSMTIHHKDNPDRFSSQGKFKSNLSVFADVIFVEATTTDREPRLLASMPAPDTVILEGTGIWTHHKPFGDVHNEKFPAGDFYIIGIEHEGPHKPKVIVSQPPGPPCGPGPHWVDRCPAGIDGTQSTAVVTIKAAPCNADGPSQRVFLGGPTWIYRSGSRDAIVGHPKLGNIGTVDGHNDVIETEMFYMALMGNMGGTNVTLRAGDGVGNLQPTPPKDYLYSPGAIEELANDPALARAFFDVYFEIKIDGMPSLLRNKIPHRMEAIIDRVPPLGTWHFLPQNAPPVTPLYNENGKEVACLVNSRHRLDPPPPVKIGTVYCVNDGDLNDSQFCYGTPVPLVNELGPVYENCDIESLDIMHSTDDLYAAAGDNTPRKSHLYYVYKHNGDVVDLGDIGGPGFLEEVDALSFHPLTDDLWGWAQDEGLFRITALAPPIPNPFPLPLLSSPFEAIPPFPEGIQIQPVVNINNPVCKKPTSRVPTIPAELILKAGGEIEDITWNQKGTILYGVENLHTDPPDSHGDPEHKWPNLDIDYDDGIKLWAYHHDTGQYQVVCPDLAPTIKEILGNEAEIEGLESLPNNSLSPPVPDSKDLIVVSFHGPNTIYYAGIVVQPWATPQCQIWIAPDRTAFRDIEGMAASPFPKPSSPPLGYPHF